ncbi:hypothetical protein BKA64DRAFT_101879 [Cadophora sp. MPI-SDFR-AT-0126]|nr:hypothetical protein BKA64DRAFT_101879 [Leotiomycetes sp. MPI-SDFR-AT-0126]
MTIVRNKQSPYPETLRTIISFSSINLQDLLPEQRSVFEDSRGLPHLVHLNYPFKVIIHAAICQSPLKFQESKTKKSCYSLTRQINTHCIFTFLIDLSFFLCSVPRSSFPHYGVPTEAVRTSAVASSTSPPLNPGGAGFSNLRAFILHHLPTFHFFSCCRSQHPANHCHHHHERLDERHLIESKISYPQKTRKYIKIIKLDSQNHEIELVASDRDSFGSAGHLSCSAAKSDSPPEFELEPWFVFFWLTGLTTAPSMEEA